LDSFSAQDFGFCSNSGYLNFSGFGACGFSFFMLSVENSGSGFSANLLSDLK
jgi:hypothetical protein